MWDAIDFIIDNIGWFIVIGFAYLVMNGPKKQTSSSSSSSNSTTVSSTSGSSTNVSTNVVNESEPVEEREVTVVPPPAQYRTEDTQTDEDDSENEIPRNPNESVDDYLESRR